jgi:prolyl-tRNA editing enzyme YbaK/EbsC (Cys-tRNA(Pro) deacylase)
MLQPPVRFRFLHLRRSLDRQEAVVGVSIERPHLADRGAADRAVDVRVARVTVVAPWRAPPTEHDRQGELGAPIPAVLGYRVATMDDDAGRRALEQSLAGRGEYELFPCDPALADTAAFCAAYGFAPEDSANTIVVVGKSNPPVYAACVVLATHRLDVNRAVKARLGTRKASFASADETRAMTGMEIGGVTVFGLPDGLPILVDAAVMRRDRIVLGGGTRSWKVIASPSILRTLPGVEVVEALATPAT